MRGSPLLRALLAFAAIAWIAWPIWALTHRRAPAPAPVAVTMPSGEAMLRLTFSQPAKSVSVSHLGQEIWRAENPTGEVERALALPWPKEGIDLLFKIDWPDAPGALRLELADPTGGEHDKTIWGRGAVEEVVGFP